MKVQPWMLIALLVVVLLVMSPRPVAAGAVPPGDVAPAPTTCPPGWVFQAGAVPRPGSPPVAGGACHNFTAAWGGIGVAPPSSNDGKRAGAVIGGAVGAVGGSFLGPLAAPLGAVGSALGGLFGGLFD